MDVETQVLGRYNISNSQGYEIKVCYMQNIKEGYSSWQIQNPFYLYLPVLAMQLSLMIFLSRILMVILKPLGQPRFVSEVIAGILIGPTYFGKKQLSSFIFPFESNILLETFANLGLNYYMFLVGLEMDLSAVRNMSKKSLSIGTATILFPLFAGAGLYFLPMRTKGPASSTQPLGAVFWAITLSITSFPDLARILSQLKLLHTDLGRTALTTSIISDIVACVLLVVAIITFNDRTFLAASIPTLIFIAICWYLLRPGIAWMIRQTEKKGEKFNNTHIYYVLSGVAVFGLVTDACGSHSMIGGLMLGLIIPKGELAITIMETIEEFVKGIMLPAFIITNGLRTNLHDLPLVADMAVVSLITVAATSLKILTSVIIYLLFGMSPRDGLALGALMNTKGVLALIVLNEGRSLMAMDNTTMSVMTFTILFMTAMVAPLVLLANKTTRRARQYKQRTILRTNPNTELRILTCIHSMGNLSGIINLLEVSNSTRRSPISVFVVHLVELLGRASTMLIVNEPGNNSATNPPSRERAESDQIFSAFGSYKDKHDTVVVQPLTIVSPYTTMHEDIFQFSEDKHVSMILIPFHKQAASGGRFQVDNHPIREVNQNLLLNSPCSVGILVDRGLRLFKSSESSTPTQTELRVAMLFMGGFDDYEALTYAYRIAGTPGVTLTVVRFLPTKVVEQNANNYGEVGSFETETEEELDDDYINEFRFKSMFDKSIIYQVKHVDNGEELLENIRRNYNEFDLYIVGRGLEMKSPLAIGLSELIDNPELGPIGDALVSSAFTSHASVLVVQQPASDSFKSRSQRRVGKFRHKKWASPVLNPDYEVLENAKTMR
ncbi:hypothetical protein ACOSP7_016354 [Xanthoceras sorbifolium]|uniref:Cation/H+ exchanger domain-containing protein n=1 Tax=Xanthoceras sorbifolium TaxID=99658 RepID=A0ABQ8HJA1_9ROSI|nr:hypothetical protein JRO89_XS10G0170700 [Xanthoceras sorbifolium]